jgi:hypothetical protein
MAVSRPLASTGRGEGRWDRPDSRRSRMRYLGVIGLYALNAGVGS